MSNKELFKNSKNIAIVRTDKIGDMILTLPLMKAIKTHYHDKNITIITRRYAAEYLELIPEDFRILRIEDYPKGIRSIFQSYEFDSVFFPRPVLEEIFAAFRSRIPLRIGSAYRAYSAFVNHKVRDHRKVSNYHEAEYNVRMLESITNQKYQTELYTPEVGTETKNSLNNVLQLNSNDKFIIVHPGSGGSARDLPILTLKDALRDVESVINLTFVITGIDGEKSICDELSTSLGNSINLCGKLSLSEMVALIERSEGMIANSTGVVHIAASLKKKVLGFYPNSPHISMKRWGPYATESMIISPPNDVDIKITDDMSLINAIDVTNSIKQLWKDYFIKKGSS